MQSINYRYVNRGSYPGNVVGNTDEYVYTRLADVDVPARYVKIVIEDYVDHPSMRAAVLQISISGQLSIVLGQEQDSFAGGFNPNQSFHGGLISQASDYVYLHTTAGSHCMRVLEIADGIPCLLVEPKKKYES